MDVKALRESRETLKQNFGYLEGEILNVAANLKDDALTQKLSVEIQKIEAASKDAARDAALKGNNRGVLEASAGRLTALQELVNQHPQLKEALLARQGDVLVSEFSREDKATGTKIIDRSAMYVSPDGPGLSIDPKDLPFALPPTGDAKFKMSEYEANIMVLNANHKKLEQDLGLNAPKAISSAPVQQQAQPAPLEMQR